MSPTPSGHSDHDQLFKRLFKSFFPELFQLFFPQVAGALLLDRATFLDTEHYTDFPTGDRRLMDLLARVPGQDQSIQTVLVHTETQEEDSRVPIDQRLFLYALTLQLRYFPEPLISVLVQFCAAREPISVGVFRYETLGSRLSLKYHRVAVKGLSAEEYLASPNPLAWALAVRMKRGRLSKAQLVLRCLAQVVRSKMNDLRKGLLVNCVMTYGKLNEVERAEMQTMLKTEEYKDVEEAELTWFDQIRNEGRNEGRNEAHREDLREFLLFTYQERLGEVPDSVRTAVMGIDDTTRLRTLRTLFFRGTAEEIASALLS